MGNNNPYARQPGTFRTGSGGPTDGDTAPLPVPPVAHTADFLPAIALQVIEVWEWVVKHRIFDPFLLIFRMDFVPS